MAITLSIGVGLNASTYIQNYEYSRIAIEMALGRGGDQVVIKNGNNITYYGGKTQQMEKNTRVKARVKAQALKEFMSTKDRVVVMGHKITDVDALGAAIGIFQVFSLTTLFRSSAESFRRKSQGKSAGTERVYEYERQSRCHGT